MFELLLDYLQIRFGNLDTCGQDVLDTDNDIRPVGICGNLAFNTGEIALDNTHPVAYNKGGIVEADTVGIQVHHEHEIGHLFVRNHKHGTGEEVFHIEKTHAIDIGKVAGRLLGGADKDQIADDRDFTALAAVLQLGNQNGWEGNNRHPNAPQTSTGKGICIWQTPACHECGQQTNISVFQTLKSNIS